ncbi:MAG: hypothetical protein WC716_16510 [Chitinophagaceae bacterium]|jgi:hypothetical protein
MKKLLFVFVFCSLSMAQKGQIADPAKEPLPANKIISIKETLVAEKTIIEKVYTDTLGNFEMKPRLIPQHIETEQARLPMMLTLATGDTILSVITHKGKEIGKLIYIINKDFAGLRPAVFKMDVK